MDAVGDVRPGPRDGRRRSNLSEVALLGRALHVVSRLHDRHIQILEVGVDVGEADGGGVLDGAVGLAPALHRRHFRRRPPAAARYVPGPLLLATVSSSDSLFFPSPRWRCRVQVSCGV